MYCKICLSCLKEQSLKACPDSKETPCIVYNYRTTNKRPHNERQTYH